MNTSATLSDREKKNAPFALYKGDAADAALLYKNVVCNDTSAKRYKLAKGISKKNLPVSQIYQCCYFNFYLFTKQLWWAMPTLQISAFICVHLRFKKAL